MNLSTSIQRRFAFCLVLSVIVLVGCSSNTGEQDGLDPDRNKSGELLNVESDEKAAEPQSSEKEEEGLEGTNLPVTKSQLVQQVERFVRKFETQLTPYNGAYYGRTKGVLVEISHEGELEVDVEFGEVDGPVQAYEITVTTNLKRRHKEPLHIIGVSDPVLKAVGGRGSWQERNQLKPLEFPLLYPWSEPETLTRRMTWPDDSRDNADDSRIADLPILGKYADRPLNQQEILLLLGESQKTYLTPEGQKAVAKCRQTFEEVFPARGMSLFILGSTEFSNPANALLGSSRFNYGVAALLNGDSRRYSDGFAKANIIEMSGAAQTWLEESQLTATDRINGTSYRAMFYIGIRGFFRSSPFFVKVRNDKGTERTEVGRARGAEWSQWSEPDIVYLVWKYEITDGEERILWINTDYYTGESWAIIDNTYTYEPPKSNIDEPPSFEEPTESNGQNYKLLPHLEDILKATGYQAQEMPDVTTDPTL